jgi:hypothetical protein
LRLGVGVGWNYVEYEALGQDFSTRGARANEQIGLMRRLWSEPLLSYEGRFDRMDRGNILPRPKRPIPIWVGGFGDAAFKRGARLGDGFMFAGPLDRCLDGWEQVKGLLGGNGRGIAGYGGDLVTTSANTIDQVAAAYEAWEQAGGTHLSVAMTGMGLDSTEAHLDFMNQVHAKLH